MKHIVCLGDSNTYGYDPRGFIGGRYPADVRWTALLEGPDTKVINYGQNGLCIPTEASFPQITALLQSLPQVDIITVMLGSNDLLEGAPVAEICRRMERFLACIRQCLPEVAVVLIADPPMQPGDWVPSTDLIKASVALAEAFRLLAEQCGVFFADAGAWNVGIAFDGVHFTEEGHVAFAHGLKEFLQKELPVSLIF